MSLTSTRVGGTAVVVAILFSSTLTLAPQPAAGAVRLSRERSHPASGARAPACIGCKDVSFTEGPPAPFAAARFDGALDPSTKRIYFLGFRQADNSTTGEVWYYDLATKTYVDAGVAMPIPVSNYQIAPLNTANGLGFFIFGGRDAFGFNVASTQVYYPATNTTAVVESDPWPGRLSWPAGCITLPATGVTTLDDRAYVMGGVTVNGGRARDCPNDNSPQVWAFDPMAAPGSRWEKQPSLNVPRGFIISTVLHGRIYAIGGDQSIGGWLYRQTTVESWAPGDLSWDDTDVADLIEACDESQAFAFSTGPLADTITLADCGGFPGPSPDVWQYNDTTNLWSMITVMNEARRNQAGVEIGTSRNPKMFVLGGYTGDGTEVLQSSEIGHAGASDGDSFAVRVKWTGEAVILT